MATSTKEKIIQDILLLRLCMKFKIVLNRHKAKANKTSFWKKVLAEYNDGINQKPKSVKQIRERFKYLFTNFAADHSLDMKFNRNLYKGKFYYENKELIEELKETALQCFHEIIYDDKKQLTMAHDICARCYTKKFEHLTEEDFKTPGPVCDMTTFDVLEQDNEDQLNITYQEVYEYECLTKNLTKSDRVPDYSYANQYDAQKTLFELNNYVAMNMNKFKNNDKQLEPYIRGLQSSMESPYTTCHYNSYAKKFSQHQYFKENKK